MGAPLLQATYLFRTRGNMFKTIVDVQTGEVKQVPLTPEEIEQLN
jgi:hypothetical protein